MVPLQWLTSRFFPPDTHVAQIDVLTSCPSRQIRIEGEQKRREALNYGFEEIRRLLPLGPGLPNVVRYYLLIYMAC